MSKVCRVEHINAHDYYPLPGQYRLDPPYEKNGGVTEYCDYDCAAHLLKLFRAHANPPFRVYEQKIRSGLEVEVEYCPKYEMQTIGPRGSTAI